MKKGLVMLQHICSTNICWTHDIATFCRGTRPFQQRVRLARLALGVLVSTESLPGSNKSTTFPKCLRINYCEGQELLSFQRRQMYIFCHCSGFVLYEQESLVHIILLGITCGNVTLNCSQWSKYKAHCNTEIETESSVWGGPTLRMHHCNYTTPIELSPWQKLALAIFGEDSSNLLVCDKSCFVHSKSVSCSLRLAPQW